MSITPFPMTTLGSAAASVVDRLANQDLGLTASQKAFRKRLIGGSDANVIMSGDKDAILRLWREKRGEVEPEDLSDVLPVQMGSFTEPLNRTWFTKQTGRPITHVGEERISLDCPYMGCTLDGLTDDGSTVWEAKHRSAFAKEDETVRKYMPQLHHNCIVAGCDRAVLSVFFGTLKYQFWDVEFDPIYGEALLAAEANFWRCVLDGEPPVAVDVPAPQVKAERIVEMTGNNAWASLCADWHENKSAAKKFDEAQTGLKKLVEADVSCAFGHGVQAKRDARGAVRFSAIRE